MTRVVSVTVEDGATETVVTVKGDGLIPEYTCGTFSHPPRIVVDLLCACRRFESKTFPLESPMIGNARIGHHPDRIRLALDVKQASLPAYSVDRQREVLRITLALEGATGEEPAQDEIQPDEEKEKAARVQPEAEPAQEAPFPLAAEKENDRSGKRVWKSTTEELVERVPEDGRPDSLLYRKGARAFQSRRWAEAFQHFSSLLEEFPQGRYAEEAAFLQAKSYEGLKASHLSTHFVDMRGFYETFLSRFPSSRYAGDALAAMGHLCFNVGQEEEAMGYYGLAFSRNKEAPAAAEALAGKMKIFMMKRRFDDALGLARSILDRYPRSAEAIEARLDMAKILHELNRFQESLTALSGLERDDVRNVYLRPEISLYLGYNGYQLGNFPMARENLFRFTNVNPRGEEIPFVLTKIGDAYRDEKLWDAAGKMYRWVAQRYPDSEGALISQIRLAELQEQGRKRAQETGLGFGAQPGEKIPSPREVYEAMLRSSRFKDTKNPLIALALLKLAVLYQKDGESGKSLAMVKELLDRFPGPQLQKETEHVLLKALEGTLARSIRIKDYHSAVRFYYEEQDLFSKIDSPELYLAMARAFLKLDLPGDAAALFNRAGSLLPDDEKPADLLYFAALDLSRRGRIDQALDRLEAAVRKGEDHEILLQAQLLTARILAEQKQWEKSLEALKAALRHSSGPCTHLEILTEQAAVQVSSGLREEALKSAREAGALTGACGNPALPAYERLGAVFSRLGRSDEALTVLTEALGRKDEPPNRERLTWKLAHTYESLGDKEASLDLYRDLSEEDDPIWTNLAKEKIEEIRFREEMDAFKAEGRRKAQPAL